jgi:TRAP-type C4-dicarboxylate transport system permease large subunit
MVLLTIPVFFPIVTGLGFDPVWFGVLIVLVVQIGLISPPVGMNLFVLNSLIKDVGLGQIFRGVWLHVLMLVLALFIVLEVQPIAMWLPSFMR